MGEPSPGIPVQSGSGALLVAGVVAVSVASFAAGFGGGFVFGQRSGPSTEPTVVSHHESDAAPQPPRAVVEDPTPIAATAARQPDPVGDTRPQQVTLSERRPPRSVDVELRPTTSVPAPTTAATNSTASTRSARSGQAGSLQVATRPSGAQVFVDDSLIGTTPLLLSNVEAGSKRLRIELPGYKTWATSIQIEPSARSRVSARLEP
jgi:PEGA domain